MKKTLLTVFSFALCALSFAQPASEASFSAKIAAVDALSEVNRTAPVAICKKSDAVYATGRFNQMLSFGESFLEPIATSAYFAKYDKDGAAQWAVSLAGAAVITAIDTDSEGNVFIAGQIADQVVFGSNDGNTTTLAGRQGEDGSYETTLSSSFIAKYDENGNLLSAKLLKPENNPTLVATGMYYPWDGDVYFKINQMKVEGNTVYASALYTGVTTADEITLGSTYMDLFGWMYMDLSAAGIFTLNTEDLKMTAKVAEVKSTKTATEGTEDQARSVAFDVNNGVVYAAFIGMGNVSMTTAAGTNDYNFIAASGEFTFDQIIAAINGDQVTPKEYKAPATTIMNRSTIDAVQYSEGNLFLGGVYTQSLSFAPAMTSTNNIDLYVAKLNAETLETISTYTSEFDEQENNKNQEVFTSMLVQNGTVYLNGYNETMDEHSIINALAYTITEEGVQTVDNANLVTSAASAGQDLVFAGILQNEDGNTTISKYSIKVPTISGLEKADDAYRNAPITTCKKSNALYTTGRFNQAFAFGESFLEPIATSAYLAKYSENDYEEWAIALQGAAVITAIDTDSEGNVFIAGQIADQVVFGSNDGNTTTLAGRQGEDGSYETTLSSSFIAKYDENGNLLSAKLLKPENNPTLVATGMYYPWDGDVYFKINQMKVEGNTVYASALYTGVTTADEITLGSTYMDLFGWMYMDLSAAGIFTLNTEDLKMTAKVAEVKSTKTATEGTEDQARSVAFDVNNGVVYAAFIGMGNVSMTTAAGTNDYNFIAASGEFTFDQIIAAINGDQVTPKEYKAPATTIMNRSTIDAVQYSEGNLFLGGVYTQSLSFAPAMTSTNNIDLYVAKLNAETLETISTYTSEFDEQENNKNQEVFTSMLVQNGTVYLNGYNETMDEHSIINALAYTIDNKGIHEMSMDDQVTDATAQGSMIVFSCLNSDGEYFIIKKGATDGIECIETPEAAYKVILSGKTLYINEPAQVVIYDAKGSAVSGAAYTTAMNLSNLKCGFYIASVKGAKGNTTLKFTISK